MTLPEKQALLESITVRHRAMQKSQHPKMILDRKTADEVLQLAIKQLRKDIEKDVKEERQIRGQGRKIKSNYLK